MKHTHYSNEDINALLHETHPDLEVEEGKTNLVGRLGDVIRQLRKKVDEQEAEILTLRCSLAASEGRVQGLREGVEELKAELNKIARGQWAQEREMKKPGMGPR